MVVAAPLPTCSTPVARGAKAGSTSILGPSLPSPKFMAAQKPRRCVVRATEEEAKTLPKIDTEKLLKDVREKWDQIDNKSTVAVYGAGAIVVAWLSSVIIGAVNAIPLAPKLLELVGLGYSAWFVYRYLLFKSSREELITDVEDLKKKIAGEEDTA